MQGINNLLITPVSIGVEELSRRIAAGCCVLVDEDCEYRKWFWFPDKEATELEHFWLALEHYDAFSRFPSETLAFGIWVDAEESTEHYELWLDMHYACRCHFLNLNLEEDSYLQTPDCEVLFHKGFTGDRAWWLHRLGATQLWRQQRAAAKIAARNNRVESC